MFDSRIPFTVAEAFAAGISAQQLRGPRFRRLFHGVYVEAGVPDSAVIRARGALLLHGAEAIATHTTAAAIYQLPVPRQAATHVMVPPGVARSKVRDIVCHVGDVSVRRIVNGIPVASPFDVFGQLASMLEHVDLVAVGDALSRKALMSAGDLVAGCESVRGRHTRAARRAAKLVRDRVDSPMETRLRLLLVLAGLPEPVVNLDVRDDAGRVVYRLDLSYPEARVAIEYDGRHHIDRQEQWQRDLRRREELEGAGWRFVVVTGRDLYGDPAGVIARVYAALKDRRFRGLPTAPRTEWRRHFSTP